MARRRILCRFGTGNCLSPNAKKVVAKPKKPKPFHKIHVILTQVMGEDTGAMAGSKKKETGSMKMRWSTTSARGWRDCWKKRGWSSIKRSSIPTRENRLKNWGCVLTRCILTSPALYPQKRAYRSEHACFLINHLYHKLLKQKVPKENIIFMSVHGDALHSSLRGATVYYPDSVSENRFRIKGRVYRSAGNMIAGFNLPKRKTGDLPNWVAHWGARWSVLSGNMITDPSRQNGSVAFTAEVKEPAAVLRYSKVPTSILVEVANLKNPGPQKPSKITNPSENGRSPGPFDRAALPTKRGTHSTALIKIWRK